MHQHKIMLLEPFERRRLGNSLSWDVAYDGETMTVTHRSGCTYHKMVEAPAFIGVDIASGKPCVFPIKKPRDPRRALLWDYDFRKCSEVSKPPSYDDFEGRYCFLPRENWADTQYYAYHYVYRSSKLFLGIVPESVKHQGFRRVWWMHPKCSEKEVRKALVGFAKRFKNAARFALNQRKCMKEGER